MYKVLRGFYLDDLTKLVNAYLSEGWLLQGGVSMSDKMGYAQAVFKP